jgi:TFIIF-interacting CTD phosphatase-like protein
LNNVGYSAVRAVATKKSVESLVNKSVKAKKCLVLDLDETLVHSKEYRLYYLN